MQFSPVLTVVAGLVRWRTQLLLTNCAMLLSHQFFTEFTETTTVDDSDGISRHRLMPILPAFYNITLIIIGGYTVHEHRGQNIGDSPTNQYIHIHSKETAKQTVTLSHNVLNQKHHPSAHKQSTWKKQSSNKPTKFSETCMFSTGNNWSSAKWLTLGLSTIQSSSVQFSFLPLNSSQSCDIQSTQDNSRTTLTIVLNTTNNDVKICYQRNKLKIYWKSRRCLRWGCVVWVGGKIFSSDLHYLQGSSSWPQGGLDPRTPLASYKPAFVDI